MLKNVRSKYILKIILSYVKEEKKLKIIKYNKNLQNIMDINLINYKFLSNRYIIYETSKRGKEYNGNDDTLLYEGEFLNGERHEKGKEYIEHYISNCFYGVDQNNMKIFNDLHNRKYYEKNSKKIYKDKSKQKNGMVEERDALGNLKFKGNYLNGEKHGEGEEFDKNGKILFEGEYLKGKRWKGRGKEFCYDGTLKYEGEYLDGKRWNGKGKEFYHSNFLKYEGEYLEEKETEKEKNFLLMVCYILKENF